MSRPLYIIGVTVALLLLFLFSACDKDSPTNPTSGEVYEANVLARAGMQMLNQAILDMENIEELSQANDLMLQSTFNAIEVKFQAAMSLDANNPTACLGMSILDFIRINYDQELWDMIDDIIDLDEGSGRILNNQIRFFAQSPKIVLKQLQGTKTNELSIHRLQNHIITFVLPRINSSLTRLNHAIALADSNSIMIDTGEEWVEVDCGEIYAFRAAVNLVYAAFNMMVAYDFDLKDDQNSHGWLNEFLEIEENHEYTEDVYDYSLENGNLTVYRYDSGYSWGLADAQREEFVGKLIKYNLEHKPSFGTISGQNYLNKARDAIRAAAADIRSGTDYIMNETDDQSNDVIKKENIISLNNEFSSIDENDPNFMQGWTSIHDVADWVETVLTQSYQLNENGVTFSVNLSAFFAGNLNDVRAYLPYHNWNQNDSWIVPSYYGDTSYWHNSYSFWMNGQFYFFENLNSVTWKYLWPEVNLGEWTDASGNPIGDEMPHFPDYTFNGILPGMTRAKFIELFE